MQDIIGLAYQSYNRAKPFIQGKFDREIRHPEWTRRTLDALGSPDHGARNIMVTGSKGKGSHAILLAAMLQRAGLRVGLFTGPHLVDFMERFRVDGEPIAETDFARLMLRVSEVSEALAVPMGQYIGPVGMLAVVAALWFREQATDVNVYECGRGALHDDVNQIVHQGAIVTPIFLEHASELGPTLQDIAKEKAGVVTTATKFVVSHRQTDEVQSVFHAACAQGDVRLFVVETRDSRPLDVYLTLPTGQSIPVHLPAGGPYLVDNAAVAASAASAVLELWPSLREDMQSPIDLCELRLPGRMQVVREVPLTVVDGTIHRASASFVRQWVSEWRVTHGGGRIGLILGLPADKDVTGVIETLAPESSFAIIAKAQNPHLHFDNHAATTARQILWDVEECTHIGEAVRAADSRLSERDLLLILGTQSFVGDALRHFVAPTQSLWRTRQPRGTAL